MDWLIVQYLFIYLAFIIGCFVIVILTATGLLKILERIFLKHFFQRFRRIKK